MSALPEWVEEWHVVDIPMTTRFRGITRRRGMLVKGPTGWGEWAPFAEYGPAEAAHWWRACEEATNRGWPDPVRDEVPVNVTVPAEGPEAAHARVRKSACRTAKVKVADPGQGPGDDIARVEAVRDALGPQGCLRIDANGAWDVGQALVMVEHLRGFDLEYVEQPCATAEELAELRLALARRGWEVPIAADESIRRSGDPERVVRLEAADLAVVKVPPLGGVEPVLELVDRLGLPVVVSSALDTSIGLRAGLALAAALPELPYACGLNTATLLSSDVVADPLQETGGSIALRDVVPNTSALAAVRANDGLARAWVDRLEAVLDVEGNRR